MAQKVIKSIVCDWADEHDDPEAEGVRTVTFGYGGAGYELDGCEAHAAKAESTLGELVSRARRISTRQVSPGPRQAARAVSAPPRKRASIDRIQAAHMRAWLRERHPDLSDRGRIPRAYADEYHAAHPAA